MEEVFKDGADVWIQIIPEFDADTRHFYSAIVFKRTSSCTVHSGECNVNETSLSWFVLS